jgi:dimethylhistidine N-methyltransferase
MTLVNSTIPLDTCYPTFIPDPADSFLQDVLSGLSKTPKQIPCKYLYDERGSTLFTKICRTREYYVTRTELTLLYQILPDIAERVGRHVNIIEYGSGEGRKIRALLSALKHPTSYTAIDISQEILLQATLRLQREFPRIAIHPLVADYSGRFQLPPTVRQDQINRRLVFFPGSTISNFEPQEAQAFLKSMHQILRPGDALLMGVDLIKSPQKLHEAYNDRESVTAEFNLNLLRRINAELDANFNLSQFYHYAFYNPLLARIEMHLISSCDQSVVIAGQLIKFRKGETIHTENSYKYTCSGIAELAQACGFKREAVWTDAKQLFSINYFTRISS